MMQNLNSKHEIVLGEGWDREWRRICSVKVGICRGDDNFVQGVDQFVIKSDSETDDDKKRKDPSKKSSVLGFTFIAKKFSRVEEIALVKKLFEDFD